MIAEPCDAARDPGARSPSPEAAAWWAFEGRAPLVGREPDLDRVGAFLDDVRRSGGPLLLRGEPGVGKTALLAAACRRAEESGMRVLAATGVEYDARLSYSGLQQLVGALHGDHDAVAAAVVASVRRLAEAEPVVLAVDDVQWLDPASAAVLSRVAWLLDGTGAGLLCTVRPGAEGFFDGSGLPVHEVAPLTDPASEELLIQRFPALAPRVRRRLVADARGNPLALLELPTVLSGSQRAAAEALPERLPLSRRLQSAFASRVTAMPAATRYLLLVAALDGSGDISLLRRAVAGRCGLKHLAPAERAELIHVDERSGLRFRHSLTRSAVVEPATGDQRRAAHQALARACADVPEQQAWHLAQAAQAPDERVAKLLEEAAAAIGRRGDGAAVTATLLRAADLSPAGPDRARRLAGAAYVGVAVTGELRNVPGLLDTAFRAAPGAESLTAAMAGSAYLLNGSGDVDTAYSLLCGALAQLPEPYDPADTTVFEALHTLLLVCFFGGRPGLWPKLDAALARYPVVPEVLAVTRSTFADPARAGAADLARLDAAVDGLRAAGDPVHIVRVAVAGVYVDRLGGCSDGLRRVVARGLRGENIVPAIDALFLLGNQAWFTGQWPELDRLAREGLDLCEQYQYPMLAWPGRFLVACRAAASGEYATVRALTDRMDQWAGPRRAEVVRAYSAHAKALAAQGRGDYEDAYQQAVSIAPAGSLPPCTPHALWVVMDLVDAAVRTGRRAEALAHVAAARAARLDALSPRLRMLVHASAALASTDVRHSGFEQALSVEGAERWPFDLARIRLYYGERLRRSRMRTQARRHLGEAAEMFGWLGAVPWTERADKELRACGSPVRAVLAVRTGREPAGVVLTPQQWEIARLAAAGLTNKQIGKTLFLSPRTVSTHLYQLFPKLGVTSRAALREALQSLEGADAA